MPDTPDSITIDGKTISREQWETMDLLWKHVNKFGTWDAFVAANTKPEHVKGERCTAPVWSLFEDEAKEIDYFLFNELSNKLTPGEWYLTRDDMIGLAEGNYTVTRWTLTAVPKQPTPKYGVGKWVVPPSGKPVQIVASSTVGPLYYTNTGLDAYQESDLRLATREDFMMEFGGVKVWMEKHDGRIRLNHRDTKTTSYGDGWRYVEEWQVAIYHTAGVVEMPKEFWT